MTSPGRRRSSVLGAVTPTTRKDYKLPAFTCEFKKLILKDPTSPSPEWHFLIECKNESIENSWKIKRTYQGFKQLEKKLETDPSVKKRVGSRIPRLPPPKTVFRSDSVVDANAGEKKFDKTQWKTMVKGSMQGYFQSLLAIDDCFVSKHLIEFCALPEALARKIKKILNKKHIRRRSLGSSMGLARSKTSPGANTKALKALQEEAAHNQELEESKFAKEEAEKAQKGLEAEVEKYKKENAELVSENAKLQEEAAAQGSPRADAGEIERLQEEIAELEDKLAEATTSAKAARLEAEEAKRANVQLTPEGSPVESPRSVASNHSAGLAALQEAETGKLRDQVDQLEAEKGELAAELEKLREDKGDDAYEDADGAEVAQLKERIAVLTAENENLKAEEEAGKSFEEMDVNKDGVINEEEFVKHMGIDGIEEEDAKKTFKELDSNGDGQLSHAEFITGINHIFALNFKRLSKLEKEHGAEISEENTALGRMAKKRAELKKTVRRLEKENKALHAELKKKSELVTAENAVTFQKYAAEVTRHLQELVDIGIDQGDDQLTMQKVQAKMKDLDNFLLADEFEPFAIREANDEGHPASADGEGDAATAGSEGGLELPGMDQKPSMTHRDSLGEILDREAYIKKLERDNRRLERKLQDFDEIQKKLESNSLSTLDAKAQQRQEHQRLEMADAELAQVKEELASLKGSSREQIRELEAAKKQAESKFADLEEEAEDAKRVAENMKRRFELEIDAASPKSKSDDGGGYRVTELEEELKGVQRKLERKEQKYGQLQGEWEELQQKNNDLRDRILQSKSHEQQVEQKLQLVQQEKAEMEAIRVQLETMKNRLEEQERESKDMQEKYETKIELISAEQNKVEKTSESTEMWKKKLDEEREKTRSLKLKITMVEEQVEEARDTANSGQVDRLASEIERLEEKNKKQENKMFEILEDNEKFEEDSRKLKKSNKKLKKELDEAERGDSSSDKYKKKLKKAERKVEKLEEEHEDAMKDLVRETEQQMKDMQSANEEMEKEKEQMGMSLQQMQHQLQQQSMNAGQNAQQQQRLMQLKGVLEECARENDRLQEELRMARMSKGNDNFNLVKERLRDLVVSKRTLACATSMEISRLRNVVNFLSAVIAGRRPTPIQDSVDRLPYLDNTMPTWFEEECRSNAGGGDVHHSDNFTGGQNFLQQANGIVGGGGGMGGGMGAPSMAGMNPMSAPSEPVMGGFERSMSMHSGMGGMGGMGAGMGGFGTGLDQTSQMDGMPGGMPMMDMNGIGSDYSGGGLGGGTLEAWGGDFGSGGGGFGSAGGGFGSGAMSGFGGY